MDGYRVDTDALAAAADAIRRNAKHVESMAAYCQSLGSNGGAFGTLLQNFRHGYDAASTTQIRVLDSMRNKLNETAEAVSEARRAYESRERDVGDTLKPVLAKLEQLPSVSGVESEDR